MLSLPCSCATTALSHFARRLPSHASCASWLGIAAMHTALQTAPTSREAPHVAFLGQHCCQKGQCLLPGLP